MARRMNPWLGWTLALAVAAGFCALGVWQLGRAAAKERWLASAQAVLRPPRHATSLAAAADRGESQGYAWAEGEGRFADAPAVLLDNQQRDGHAGVRVYRLFVPAGAPPLLVELGWLPLPGDRRLPVIEHPSGSLRLRGLLAPPPAHGLLAATAVRSGGVILATGLDAPSLAAQLDVVVLSPRVLRLDPALEGIGYARDLDVLPNTMPPARHLAYAAQWFGLALTVLVTAAVLSFRRRRARRAKMAA